MTGRDSYAIFLKTWNGFRPLGNEPRFQALIAQIGNDRAARLTARGQFEQSEIH